MVLMAESGHATSFASNVKGRIQLPQAGLTRTAAVQGAAMPGGLGVQCHGLASQLAAVYGITYHLVESQQHGDGDDGAQEHDQVGVLLRIKSTGWKSLPPGTS